MALLRTSSNRRIGVVISAMLVATGLVSGMTPGKAAMAADPATTNAFGWGFNLLGQVGSGSGKFSHLAPVPVVGAHRFTAIAAGQTHTVALKADGTVWFWGDRDPIHYSPVVQDHVPIPVQVPELSGISRLAAGADVSLAMRPDGTTWAWGANESGQLCDGTDLHRPAPVKLPLAGIIGIATSGTHTLLQRQDGTVWACGDNSRGQLGDGTLIDRATPVRVLGLTGVVEIATGMNYSLARRSDSTVWGWGENEKGQLATGAFSPHRATAAALSGLSNITAISAGLSSAMALTSSGQVRSWGENFNGQLCDGTQSNRAAPVAMVGLPGGASQIAAGRFSVVVRVAGSAYTCGGNASGQLGDGTVTSRFNARLVPGLQSVQYVAIGGSHVLALGA